ncbi:hypothetical protein SOCE26_032020 [Sorangium cellulosum]|uniref:N-acetyltransferase domain-containing protein n=1 Tax=Sorangium cellulosum TaxID=56 RepID=A0A2L0ER56_SORCE|nr:hypothetical protein [Sorangium cellulosum]AUX41779.1 hypothetical protein SOCE26_032020 [Sorangium cellulosum]
MTLAFDLNRDDALQQRRPAPADGPGCFGDAADYRAQRILYAARGWIAEQDGLTTDGRALILLHAHKTPPDRRETLVRCFERVLLHAPRPELPALAASLRQAGLSVDEAFSVMGAPAGEVHAAVQGLGRFRSFPAGLRLSRVSPEDDDDAVGAIQELQAESGHAPLPGWTLRGGEGRSVTLALWDAAGALIGCTTLCVVTRPDPGGGGREPAAQLGLLGAPPLWISDVGEAPSWTGMPICTCLREDYRGRGLGAPLQAAALREGHERFGIRWFYALVRAGDEIAKRMNARCGLAPHRAEGFLLASAGPSERARRPVEGRRGSG